MLGPGTQQRPDKWSQPSVSKSAAETMMGVLLLSASTTSLREPTSPHPIPAVVVNDDVPFTVQLGKGGSGLCGANMAPYSLDSDRVDRAL